MTKFGDLISAQKPVLIDFYSDLEGTKETTKSLRSVSAVFGEKAKIIKIDVVKNELLADALEVKENPTFMIYKEGQMKWRHSGSLETNDLIDLVQQYL
ncbi:thioredoxin family protein [Polaribacter tangerinus]|uniref:thioredoxin family protein n=1 Tax=Polaribacter tangerinus TaxID=1920034 RepID=UPI000B4B6507|nr:thioredoxin family protein [Polaribacter tangerinus]